MVKLFTNILLPVCLNNDIVARTQQAVRLANQFHCNLHLLHFAAPRALEAVRTKVCRALGIRVTKAAIRQKLAMLRLECARELNPGLLFQTDVVTGDPLEGMTEYIQKNGIDLIMVYADIYHLHPDLFRPDSELCQLLPHHAIMSLDQCAAVDQTKNIVVPVGSALEVNKLRFAAYIADQFSATIHLVAIPPGSGSTVNFGYLEKAFRILRENTHLEVICRTLDGSHANRRLINYAESIMGAMVISSTRDLPGIRKRGFWKLRRLLRREAAPPLLAVG
ncbi:MAG TPA: universal stress protein [Chitinophagaceae bacterium]|nr:universal stress protein [Chitinophagaceae bacterium]